MDKKVLNLKRTVKGKVIAFGIDVHGLSWQITALAAGEVIMAVTTTVFYMASLILNNFKNSP